MGLGSDLFEHGISHGFGASNDQASFISLFSMGKCRGGLPIVARMHSERRRRTRP